MKKSQIITLIVLIVLAVLLVWIMPKKPQDASPAISGQPVSVEGCYVATNNKDVYKLNIQSQQQNQVSGTLAFNNYEKDSSSGTISGTYTDGTILANYTFNSEGTTSTMQVAFKKSGDDFIRGVGDLDSQGILFVDPNKVAYDSTDPLAVFKKQACTDQTPDQTRAHTQISFPVGGEQLTLGKTYTLKWSGGADATDIFLIDTSLESVGASVSLVDRVYHVPNTGSYQYTIPTRLSPGTYKIEIGDSTSNPFKIVK